MTTRRGISFREGQLVTNWFNSNVILPYPKRWTEKILLGVTHVINTIGIAVGTYGGAPSATAPGGVFSPTLAQLGNILMLLIMFSLIAWLGYTYRRIMAVRTHPNARPAMYMLVAALAAIPFQVMRLVYGTAMAFDNDPSLNPVMGTFAAQFVLVFSTQLGFSIVILVGGIMGIPQPKSMPVDDFSIPQDIEPVETGEVSLISQHPGNSKRN
jgi:hypothetical protein